MTDTPTSAPPSRLAPLERALAAAIEWLAHIAVVLLLLVGFRLIEHVVHLLWRSDERMFFEVVPLQYIFDAADLSLLIGFVTYGTYSVLAAYRKTR